MSQTMEQTDTSSMRGSDAPDKKPKSRRPANTAFRQQRLKAWQPILTPKTVLPLFFAVGIIMAPLGGGLLYASSKVQQIAIDYSGCDSASVPQYPAFEFIPTDKVSMSFKNTTRAADYPQWSQSKRDVPHGRAGNYTWPTTVCHLQFWIPDNLSPPVLLYYQLTNFYQNHRRYVTSYDQDQLKGKFKDAKSVDGGTCTPLTLAPNGKPYYPCGLIANSLFNDTFQQPILLNAPGMSNTNVTYNMTSSGTAWASDADLYGNTEYSYDDVVPPPNWHNRYPHGYNSDYPFPNLTTDDAFQVWMRTAGLPTFSKLAKRNDEENMQIGSYQIEIYNDFPVNVYDGTKSILISTHTIIGGKNPFLGIAWIVVGGICILLGALFTVTQLIKPRKLGDHSYLSWNTDQPSTATTTGRAPRPGEAA